MWSDTTESIELCSTYLGPTIPLRDLYAAISSRGWQVTKVKYGTKGWEAEAKHPDGRTIQKTAPTQESAVQHLLLGVTHVDFIRTYTARLKLGMWETTFVDKLKPIADAYNKAPAYDPKAVGAFMELAQDSLRRLETLKGQLQIEVVDDPEPYADVQEMADDIHKHKHFSVSRTGSDHPLWSVDQHVAFRAVHDILGHVASGGDFGWTGENRACAAHFPLLSPEAQKALFSECIAQTAYAIQYRGFSPQKIVLLEDEIEHAQAKENGAGHQGVHPSQALAPTESPQVPHLSKRYKAHHVNKVGEPCGCPWNRDALTKEAAKLDWLQDRPDVKNDFRKHLIVNHLFPTYGPEADAALPWLLREYNKGRLKMPEDWHDLVEAHQQINKNLADFLRAGGHAESPEGRDLSQKAYDGVGRMQSYTGRSDLHLDNKPIRPMVQHIAPMLEDLSRRRQGIDLMKQDAPTLLERVHTWREEKEEREREEERQRLAGQIVHKFNNGWSVRRLRTADEANLEGDQMGHCVGSYGNEVENGDTNIFSLRDEKNMPHATMEVHAPSHDYGRHSGWYVPSHVWDELPMDKFKGVPIDELRAHHDRVHNGNHRGEHPDVYHDFMNKAAEHGSAMPSLRDGEVVQTQGKSNQAPLPEYTEWLDEFLHPHGLQGFKPWWNDHYYMDGPQDFRGLLGYNGDDGEKFGLKGYPQDDWYEGEPDEYSSACSEAEEHGMEPPELHIDDPDYYNILKSVADPEADSRYDYENGRYRTEKPWSGYNPQAGQYVFDHAVEQQHTTELADAMQRHIDELNAEPFVPSPELDNISDRFERERAQREAEHNYWQDEYGPENHWLQMANHLGPQLFRSYTPIGPQQQRFEVHPEQQQFFPPGGVYGAFRHNAGSIDPNQGWQSGVEPVLGPNGASLSASENDPLGIHRPNVKGVTATDMARNLATIDPEDPNKRWWQLENPDGTPARAEQKKAVVNAFSAVLLSPQKNLRWNTIHYQDLADVVHTTEDPNYLHKRLEQRRTEWNRARKISPLAHKPYYQEQQDFARWLKAKTPGMTDDEAHAQAADKVRTLLEQEKVRLRDELAVSEAAKPPEKRMNSSQIEAKAGREVQKILKAIMSPAHDPATDFHEQGSLLHAAVHPPSQMSIAAPEGASMDPSVVQMFDGSINPEAMGAYACWFTESLKSIAQISRHAEAILDVSLRDINDDKGAGHRFRSYVLSLGIPGVGPKVTSFAWLLLCPELSQLATIDTHMLEVLGRKPDAHPSPRDYFKLEREFRARLDAAGYTGLPLGSGQWAMWDYKRGGRDTHQDHAGLRPLNFVQHDNIDWNAKAPKPQGSRWKADPWWETTQGVGDQVGDHFDQTIGANFRQHEIPFKDSPHHIAASASEFHVAWAVPHDVRTKISNWVTSAEWPAGHELDDPAQYHITIAYAKGGWKDSDQHALVKQFTSTDLPFESAGLDLFGPDKDCVVLRLSSEVAFKWANRIMDALEANGLKVSRYDGYKAHISLGTATSLPKHDPLDLSFRAGKLYISQPRALAEKETIHPLFSALNDPAPSVTHPDGESDVGAPGETIMQYLRSQHGMTTEQAWAFPGAVAKVGP